jgi:hypothetical protein
MSCDFCGATFAVCRCENQDDDESEEEISAPGHHKGKQGGPVACGAVHGDAWYTFPSGSGCKNEFNCGDPSSISKRVLNGKLYLRLFWWSISEMESYGPAAKNAAEMRQYFQAGAKRKLVGVLILYLHLQLTSDGPKSPGKSTFSTSNATSIQIEAAVRNCITISQKPGRPCQ